MVNGVHISDYLNNAINYDYFYIRWHYTKSLTRKRGQIASFPNNGKLVTIFFRLLQTTISDIVSVFFVVVITF